MFLTEVLDPITGNTVVLLRKADKWCRTVEEEGYIVTNTEQEIPSYEEE